MNESDDIHAFLDQVINDVYKYNDTFNQAMKEGELSYKTHQERSELRRELFGDVKNMSAIHQLSNKENILLDKLMHFLHLKEHQMGSSDVRSKKS